MTIMSENNFTVYVEQDEDGIFIGSIPSIPSCYAQGSTKQEMMKNLKEVTKLCLNNQDISFLKKYRFIGTQNLDISHA